MAVHLLLLAANTVAPGLAGAGYVKIYSDLFRRLRLGGRAASISHPYLMQVFRYTKNDTRQLQWPLLSLGIYPC